MSWRDRNLDTYVVDFDGTIAHEHWPDDEQIGEPIRKNIEKMWTIKDLGHKIEVFTSRPAWHRPFIEHWLTANAVPFDRVTFGKPIGIKYIDNKGVNSEAESWI